jgi:restriction system protein
MASVVLLMSGIREISGGYAANPNAHDLRGHWLLASNYDLVEDGPDGGLRITEVGQDFLRDPHGDAVRLLDEREGLFKILTLVAELGPGKRAAFIEPWTEYATRVSNVRGDTTARSYLLYRMNNLRSRGFLERSGATWAVTEVGLAYLRGTDWEDDAGSEDEDATLRDLLAAGRTRVRDQIRELLHAMDPFAFERLIGTLLEALGYQDVEVTKPAGDKGVDVTARIELGITAVREVVQAKRQKGNVQRTVLDSLRGSLHRWRAVRGTIITTSDFSKGAKDAAFEHGAAPITLIDGEKLLDLLIENEIGVSKRKVEVWDLDADAFAGGEDVLEEEPG